MDVREVTTRVCWSNEIYGDYTTIEGLDIDSGFDARTCRLNI